ncbi:MAG: hydrogenase [Lentisphaerae bacterium]|nr:hydrogenase [Lentisphaerota bacterium]
MSTRIILVGLLLSAISGLPGLFMSRHSHLGPRVAACLGGVGCLLGLAGLAHFWFMGPTAPVSVTWSLPGDGLSAGIDGLSAIFLAPVLFLSLLAHVYGLGYWPPSDHPATGVKLRVFLGLLTCGMALLVLARDAILFIFGWEIMALAAFFLVTTEDHKAEAREAGWVYFVATHTSTLILFGMFALLHRVSGSYALAPLAPGALPPGAALAIFVTALGAFGLKAGLMPLHVWLPGAHAAAPSHVSALMSGVLIKMGIYGLVRITSLLPDPPLAWGGATLLLGVVSAVLGVAFAIGQHDLKRLLAYHSIENIGIIVMGLGLALMGRSLGRADLVMLGMAGCLLHVWNHALFKGLLFLSAGAVVHATGTREMDRLGALARRMPHTALAFLVGAIAICGLPPLNGFVSELCIYIGLLRTLSGVGTLAVVGAVFAAPALALVGALAAACFAKAYGTVFLGQARSPIAQVAHEAPWTMTAPMAVLGASCVLIGLVPLLVAPALEAGVVAWAPALMQSAPPLRTWVPLPALSVVGLALLALLGAGSLVLRSRQRQTGVAAGAVWGCGYVAPSASMQYTSASFAQMLVAMFAWALRPRRHGAVAPVLFPARVPVRGHVPEVVLDLFILPPVRLVARVFTALRVLQQGQVNAYLLYVFLALVVLLMWR